jgi:fatty acid desaturase
MPMPALAPESAWVANINVKAVEDDFRALGKKLDVEQGPADVAHMLKIRRCTTAFTVIGWLFMWLHPMFSFPAVLLSLGTFGAWTMIGHHVSHGGYTKIVDQKSRFRRFTFAVGNTLTRLYDWPDHMLPEAWDVEHNHMHHYNLNEHDDPDLVERNLVYLRDMKMPLVFKYALVAFFMCTWKWFYYAVNTFAILRCHETKTTPSKGFYTLADCVNPKQLPAGVRFLGYFIRVAAPYLVYQFVLLPMPLKLGASFLATSHPDIAAWCAIGYRHALINLVIADVLTNIHAFIVIVTNHAGLDMYRYKTHAKPLSAAFYIRAVVSSANYAAGTDPVDYMHGWLNYQVEHHCYPKLSMLSYQKAMPQVKALCAKHGIPYTQESVFIRLKKTVDSMVGATTMREIPIEWEHVLNGDDPAKME